MNYPRFERLRISDYCTAGIKIYTNGLAWRWDSYHSCLLACTYCFARVLEKGALERAGVKYDIKDGRIGDLSRLANRFHRIFDEETIDVHDFIDWCIVKRWMPEVGAMGEPFLMFDQELGVTMGLLQLLQNYSFPLFVCTKAPLLVNSEEYYDALVELKKNGLIVDVSIISIDDDRLRKYEPLSPLASERLKLVERLVDDGVNVVASCRPFIAGLTDVGFDDYIETLCQTGIKAIHIRQFYITSYLIKRWKKWIEEHKDIIKRYGFNYKYKGEYLEQWFERAIEIAEPYNVSVTGGSRYAMDKPHKMDYELIDDEARKHLFPYTVMPMLQKVRGREPHIMYFDDYCAPLIKDAMDADIRIDAETMILTHSRSCQIKPRLHVLINFRDILGQSLWDGWNYQGINRDGKICSTDIVSDKRHILRIVKDKEPIVDDDGHLIYAWLPEGHLGRDVKVTKLKEVGLW